MTSVPDIIQGMTDRFNKDAAAGMSAVYQYHITGDGGGHFYSEINDGELNVAQGDHDSPNITITISAEDYMEMVDGKLNGQMAFMTGKLKIDGDMSLAMKLGSLFNIA